MTRIVDTREADASRGLTDRSQHLTATMSDSDQSPQMDRKDNVVDGTQRRCRVRNPLSLRRRRKKDQYEHDAASARTILMADSR